MTRALFVVVVLLAIAPRGVQDEEYLRWSSKEADAIGRSTYKQGRVGGLFDTRVLKTERSYNYKLAATWLTPDIIRSTARLAQLRRRMSDEDTRRLVHEAETPDATVVMVEIDPREGSGVIPEDWEAMLGPQGRPDVVAHGKRQPQLRDVQALAGVLRRNYDYDRFWVVFPLAIDNQPLFASDDRIAQLVIRIHDKEGRVEWPIPASIRHGRR